MDRSGQLILASVHLLRFAAKSDDLAQKIALVALVGLALAELVGKIARKPRDAECITDAEALVDFRVEIDRRALPQSHAQKGVRHEIFRDMGLGRQALRSG